MRDRAVNGFSAASSVYMESAMTPAKRTHSRINVMEMVKEREKKEKESVVLPEKDHSAGRPALGRIRLAGVVDDGSGCFGPFLSLLVFLSKPFCSSNCASTL